MKTPPIGLSFRCIRAIALLLIFATPCLARAQFLYQTNNGAITITGYNGSGGPVVIPDTINGFSVVQIATNAFASKTTITSVVIPGSVTNIGVGAFSSCTALTSISVDPSNGQYSSSSGVLFNKVETTLLQFPPAVGGTFIVPESVTAIADQAFAACARLTNVVFPSGLLTIGANAFSNCIGLTSVSVPNLVKSIPQAAFANCSGLTSLTIPGSVTNIGPYAFTFSGITELTIQEGTISIGNAAFSNADKLMRIRLASTVKSIGVFAFSACTSLTEAYFAGDPPSAGSDPFAGAQNLVIYYCPGTIGWSATFGARPTVMWNATISGVSVTSGQNASITLTIGGASGLPFVVETSSGLTNPSWLSISTNRTASTPMELKDIPALYTQGSYRLRSP